MAGCHRKVLRRPLRRPYRRARSSSSIWTIPTLGILVSSLRDKDQIIASGWWNSFSSSTQTEAGRLPAASAQVEKDGKFVIEGNIFGDGPARNISAFGVKSANPTQYRGRHRRRPRRRRDLAGQCRRHASS